MDDQNRAMAGDQRRLRRKAFEDRRMVKKRKLGRDGLAGRHPQRTTISQVQYLRVYGPRGCQRSGRQRQKPQPVARRQKRPRLCCDRGRGAAGKAEVSDNQDVYVHSCRIRVSASQ
jgi:hypothetical protein